MKDIAEMAGVGKTTVSRYFNGVYVKEETRLKIKKIIDQYNYQPNTFAQSLKAKETKIIGIIAPTLTSTTRIFSECSMLECNKDLELYYLDSFKIVHEK